jgi:hypothetical protein
MRGYFDGDGSISTYMNTAKRALHFGLRGTQNFLESFRAVLERNGCLSNLGTGIYKQRGQNTLLMSYKGNKNCLRIRDFLYKDTTPHIYLERKHQRYFDTAYVDLIDRRFKHNKGL